MNWNRRIRQNHRRLSVIFMAAVVLNIVLNVVASGQEDLTVTVGLLTVREDGELEARVVPIL